MTAPIPRRPGPPGPPSAAEADDLGWPGTARIWDEPDGVHIDVRRLPAPLPMVQILQLLQKVARDTVVTVHHERDPVWLYPELAQIGWWAEPIAGAAGEVRLRLTATS